MSISFPKCNQAGIEFVISTNEELQEESKFLSEEFPIAMYTQNFNHAASDSIPFHWHDELQITWISDGELEYCISGDNSPPVRSDKLLLLQEPSAPQFPHHRPAMPENPVHQALPRTFSILMILQNTTSGPSWTAQVFA